MQLYDTKGLSVQDQRRQEKLIEKKKLSHLSERDRTKVKQFSQQRDLQIETIQVCNLVEMQIRVGIVYTCEQTAKCRVEKFRKLRMALLHLKDQLLNLPFFKEH